MSAADNTAKANKAPASTVTRSRARTATPSPSAPKTTRATAKKVAGTSPAAQSSARKPAATGRAAAKQASDSNARPARKVTTARIAPPPARKKVAAARTTTPRTRASAKVDAPSTFALAAPAPGAPVVPSPRPTPTASLNGHAHLAPAPQRYRAPLWSSRQLLWWGGIVGLSIVACFIAYIISAGKATLSSEAPSLNIAIFSLVIAGGANVWLLVVGRRAIGMRRRALLGEPAATVRRSVPKPTFVATSDDDAFVADPALTLYHRPTCALAVGRHWAASPRAAHEHAGRTACGVCRP